MKTGPRLEYDVFPKIKMSSTKRAPESDLLDAIEKLTSFQPKHSDLKT